MVCGDRGLPDPVLLTRMEGQRLASGFIHNAVLSVSLSMSSRMWPGTSLLDKSECISGKMFRSDSETLELVSVTILEAVGAAGARPLSPTWVPGGCGGGGTLGRLRGLGTGRGLGSVPCCCVVSLCERFCLAKGGVLGGVGVCGGVGPGSGPCSPSLGCVGGCGGGWLGAWMGGRLLELRRVPGACCWGGDGLRVFGFGDVPVPVPGELCPPEWPGGGFPGFGGAGAGFFTARRRV